MKHTPRTTFLFCASASLLVFVMSACERAPTHTSARAAPTSEPTPAPVGESVEPNERAESDADRLQGYWENETCSVNISGHSLFYKRADEWFQTEFTLPPDTEPKQLHATILDDSSGTERDIGTVVVALFKIEHETLTLVALTEDAPTDSFETPNVLGRYVLERADPRPGRTSPPTSE